ncbi:MAG: YbaY family lipoprotein [Candidatus Dechloromonas phosphoritropha]
MKSILLPVLSLFMLTLAHAGNERLTYKCDDGSSFQAEFMASGDGVPQATVFMGMMKIVLPQVPAASGALYRADTISLHTKGDDALFDDGRNPLRRCTSGELPTSANLAQSPAASANFVEFSGSVAYVARGALPPDAVLIIRIQDTARADGKALTLAEQRIELAGQQVPIPFKMTVDRDLLPKRARITVAARIQRGNTLLFINDTAYPALKDGKPQHVDMTLKPVAQPKKR